MSIYIAMHVWNSKHREFGEFLVRLKLIQPETVTFLNDEKQKYQSANGFV